MTKTIITITLALVLAASILVGGCQVGSSINGSGKTITQDVAVTDFTSIEVEGNFSVEINQSDNFGVAITTDDNLIGRVLVSREEETLKLAVQAAASFLPTTLKAKISMPKIYALKLSKGAKVGISSFKSTHNFDMSLTDVSVVNGFFDCGNVNFKLTGGSQANLKGAGLSMLDLSEFVLNSAIVNLKGASECTIDVKDKFDIFLSGASKLYYEGNPTVNNASITDSSFMQHK